MLIVAAAAAQSSHWAVVTSINAPTLAIRQLSRLRGWKTVVIGDAKSPPAAAADWASLPNVVYLDLDAQALLTYKILAYLPLNHYARKSIGYLYAIRAGAKWIYDTGKSGT